MTDLTTFKSNSLVSSDLFSRLMETNKALAGGGGGSARRISIRGGRFREIVGGTQTRVNSSGSMNVVIVRSSGVVRTYFEGAYDPEKPAPPTCWSQDSNVPAPEVPEDQRQSNACRDCRMNIKGSGQGNSRACRFSARLAVCLEGDYSKIYQLQVPATSLFGESVNGNMPLQAYAKFLTENGMPTQGLVTQMYFDENSETPKLFFKPVRPLEEEELQEVLEHFDTKETMDAVTLTVSQTDAKRGEAPKPAKAAKPAAKPAAKAPVEDDDTEVEGPTRVEKKAASTATPDKLNDVLSAWDD